MKRKTESIEDYIDAMMRGEVPTSSTFTCPGCGCNAHIGVGGAPGDRVLRSVAGWCEECDDGVEMDGVQPWPGWEDAVKHTQPHTRGGV